MNKEEIEALQKRYKLTDEEYEEYRRNVIFCFTVGKTKNKPNKKLVFVAGQAGAGKSKLIPVVNNELQGDAVISDYDIVRSLHPKYNQAVQDYPENVHLALLPDANQANEDLRHYCRDNGMDLIYEGTMRGTQVFIDIATEFKEFGYDIDLRLMAVPKLESYGSTLSRYALDLDLNNIPRWVPKSVHDESYEKFIVTVRELMDRGLYDKAIVYRRGRENEDGIPAEIYSTENRQFPNPVIAILNGREQYRNAAIQDFPAKYSMVSKILSEKDPSLLHKLEDWKALYEEEHSAIMKSLPNKEV